MLYTNHIMGVKKAKLTALLFGASLVFLGSCSSVPQDKTSAELELEKTLLEAKSTKDISPPQVPEAISGALMSGAIGNNTYAQEKNERFDISVNQVPAKTFFLSLVADSGVNVVAHPDVSGNISLELKNVTVREALDVTRDVFGYEYKYQKNIYTIYPRKLRTEVFPIDYLDIQRVGVSDTGVLIGTISSGGSGNGNNNQSSSSSNNNSSSASSGSSNLLSLADSDKDEKKSSGGGIAPGARVQTLNKTNFWFTLQKTLSAIIGGEKNGRMVMTNPQSGLVVVTALPKELGSVRSFLEKSELSVKRQVILETKIIEVQLSEGFEAGINWGAISGALSSKTASTGFNSVDDRTFGSEGSTSSPFRSRLDIQTGTFESTFTSLLEVVDITKLLKLLETQGHVQVLSSPRISTVNNQKALIRVGTDEFFVTGISNSTTSSAATVVNTPEIILDSFFSGIALDVTPQIADNGEVILHIHPIVSKVQDQLKEIAVGQNKFSLPLALRDIRESDSIVRAKSGQVVVLGGLMQESSSDLAGKRPYLGDVPGLNALFRTRDKSKVKTELVILMRPIVVQKNTWEDEINRRADRVGRLSDEYRSR